MNKGVALYLTIVIMSVLTAALLALIGISVSQIKVIQTTGDSVVAFYAADTGVEQVLDAIYEGVYVPLSGECRPQYSGSLTNGATYKVCISGSSTSTIQSTGAYKKTKRRIEIYY